MAQTFRSRTPNAHAGAIKFGFEFIEIGHFRLGAADDEHFSLSCRGPVWEYGGLNNQNTTWGTIELLGIVHKHWTIAEHCY